MTPFCAGFCPQCRLSDNQREPDFPKNSERYRSFICPVYVICRWLHTYSKKKSMSTYVREWLYSIYTCQFSYKKISHTIHTFPRSRRKYLYYSLHSCCWWDTGDEWFMDEGRVSCGWAEDSCGSSAHYLGRFFIRRAFYLDEIWSRVYRCSCWSICR